MKPQRVALICLAILAIALWLRLPGLDTFLTPDEEVWSAGTAQFMTAVHERNWTATTVSGHPAVTTMWAGISGISAMWLLDRPQGAATLGDVVRMLAADPLRRDFLPWLRFPVALACSLGILAMYLLARRLFAETAALLAAALLSFDPFLLAHSRVLQMDALLATALTVSLLALLVAQRTGRRRFFVFSGLVYGLAVLTKSPALVLGPLVIGLVVVDRWRGREPLRAWTRQAILDLLAFGLPAVLVAVALWPALWAAPLATAQQVWGMMTTYSQAGHELGNFWLGSPVASPGHGFYVVAFLLRSTPATLLGLVLLPLLVVIQVMRRPTTNITERPTVLALCVFVLWFGALISAGDKQFDRYLLPIFPAAALLAAWSWTEAGRLLWAWAEHQPTADGATDARILTGQRAPSVHPCRIRGRPRSQFQTHPKAGGRENDPGSSDFGAGRRPSTATRVGLAAGAALLVGSQVWMTLVNQPTYFTAYNPLAGGVRAARSLILVGWGEGLAEAAGYLDRQPGAESATVATWYGQNVFKPFYRGKSYDLYYDLPKAADLYTHDVDYVVTYVNQEQRRLLDPEIGAHLGAPIFTQAYDGVPFASVFKWPKPFAHTVDRSLGDGLRLLGWTLGEHEVAAGKLPVTLYWDADALAKVGEPPQTVVWIKDDAGEVWATGQGSPTAGFLVQAWLGRQAVAQELVLSLPAGLLAGHYRVEVAPFGGKELALGQLALDAARQADWPSLDVADPGRLVFGGQVQLAGYTLDLQNGQAVLDLVWLAQQTLPRPYKFFVHLADAEDHIVAQYDGPLAALPNAAGASALQAGELARQRVRLALPSGQASGPYRVYVGIYDAASGARLAASADSLGISDGRALLTTLAAK